MAKKNESEPKLDESPNEKVEDDVRRLVRELVRGGVPAENIVDLLIDGGLEPNRALSIVLEESFGVGLSRS